MSEATISSLELEILSSSKNAESGLDDLINTLGRLKSATKGGLGLTSVVKQLNNLKTSVDGVNTNGVNNITGLAKAIQLLSGTKISSSIGNQIKNISTALSTADFTGGQAKITELVTALKPLESLGKSSLSSTVNALNKLPDALSKIDTRKLYNQINSLTRIFKPFADEMQKVANGFSAFPSKIQRLISSTNSLATTNNKAAKSYINLYAKLKMAATSMVQVARKIATGIEETMTYHETVNLFSVSMGKYAEEAYNYAQQVSDIMGIDPAQWMKYQGTIMTLATGFGIAGDKANIMSQQLTQLAYDISSYADLPIAEAMQKIQSGFSGELEPLRNIGYDLSQAKLEAIAFSLGIDKSVSSMTQAEKAQLRYYAIMTQVTMSHEDMANTLSSPANQMRIFRAQITQTARAIGGIFIPGLNAILPYAIAVAKVIGYLASAISSLFGYELPEIKETDMDVVVSGAEGVDDALGNATKSAKKLKSYLLGFDELNVLDPNSGGSDDDNSSVGGDLGFELPTYDFLGEATESRVNNIVKDMKEWLGLTDDIDSWSELLDTRFGNILTSVGLIGAGFLAWKISTGFLTALETLKKLTGTGLSWGNLTMGLPLFLQDLATLKGYIDDIAENGANFSNVTGILSTFTGLIGDTMILLGKTKLGGALKIVEGIGQIVSGIADISENGVNFNNITNIINGLSNVVIGIGAVTKNYQLMGIGMALQGITTIVKEIGENWEAIKKGDWSGVDKAKLVIGAIELIGGIVIALGVFKTIKSGVDTVESVKNIGDVTTTVTDVGKKTSTLTTKLKTLVTNLGLGIVVIAEVAVAAGLIVGAIWGLGVLLEQTGKAWEPVIDNGGTVTTAMIAGTAILVGVGTLSAALGKSGKTLIKDLAAGTAMLVLMGVDALLFVAEIWAIGHALDKVGKAWQPVLDNGSTIKTAIKTGTVILAAVGVVCAALGALTIASGGTVALALAAGTGMLVLIGADALLFIAEIKSIGTALKNMGKAWQPVLDNGDTIKTGIKSGTAILIGIGVVSAALGVASVASVGLLPLAIAAGTGMLEQLSDATKSFVKNLTGVANKLNDDLKPALDELAEDLPDLSSDMEDFTSFMGDFATKVVDYTKSSAIANFSATIDKIVDFFTADAINSLTKDIGKQYDKAVKLIEKLELAIPKIQEAAGLLEDYNDAMADLKSNADDGSSSPGVLKYLLDFAVQVKNNAKTWWSNVKNWWKEKVGDVADFTTNVKNNASTWWSNVKSWWHKDSSNGVDLKVNAKKSWTGTLKSFLGIEDSFDLGFRLPKIKVKWGEKEVLGFKITFPSGFETYAKGGFPDMGQMFIAREAGPELVGNIGSRTAVVNNDQIVDSVSTGVYQAVVAALGSGNGDGDNTQIVINLDGEKIYENQQKIARNRGYNLGMGAFSFG